MAEATQAGLSQALSKLPHPRFPRAAKPVMMQLAREKDRQRLAEIVAEHSPIFHDSLQSQMMELFKIRHPQEKLSHQDLEKKYGEWAAQNDAPSYGAYAYYPWSNRLLHLLDEKEYAELRTSRNQYKITPEEQRALARKSIGLIGLSVGQSVALAMAIERGFGLLKIADFDILELSNLNRIRSGAHNIGLPKTTVVAREIAEIDPYLKVEIFEGGITPENIGAFLGGENPIDLLIEECDSLPIKILARTEARAREIPVLMDTSDRGMIDIERFDQEPGRPLFHGRCAVESLDELAQMTPDQQRQLMMEIVDFPNTSARMKQSFSELGKTLTTWPQLASAVMLGGAAVAHLARKILTARAVPSGRFYVDVDQICGVE